MVSRTLADKMKVVEATPLEFLGLHRPSGSRSALTTRAELILILADEKPATEIRLSGGFGFAAEKLARYEGLENYDSGRDLLTLDPSFSRRTCELLDQLELPYRQIQYVSKTKWRPIGSERWMPKVECNDVAVAKDNVWLEQMVLARQSNDDSLLGKCFGLPATAVSAFCRGAGTFMPDHVKMALSSVAASYFTGYLFESNDFDAGLDTARRWESAIKSHVPALYEQMQKSLV